VSANADNLIDDFVAAVNAGHREPIALSDCPPSVCVDQSGQHGYCDWRIKHSTEIDWVAPLEARLHKRFPTLYRSLITRYVFPSFELGDIQVFANTAEGSDFHELRTRLFSDEHMAKFLLPNGYVQFGMWLDYKQYDAVCFDTNRSAGSDDHPIVQIDHEAILCYDTINVIKDLAGSFEEMIKQFVQSATRCAD